MADDILIETMARAIYEWQGVKGHDETWEELLQKPSHSSIGLHAIHYRIMAEKVLKVVLSHYGAEENISPEMMEAYNLFFAAESGVNTRRQALARIFPAELKRMNLSNHDNN